MKEPNFFGNKDLRNSVFSNIWSRYAQPTLRVSCFDVATLHLCCAFELPLVALFISLFLVTLDLP
jgi:hypothetical protein